MNGNFPPCGNWHRRRRGGFTLIELVISIMLIGMLAAVGSSMLADTFTVARTVNAANASAGQARYALERVAREIREVKYASSTLNPATYCNPPTNTLTDRYCITTMSPTQMVFTKTVGGTDVTITVNKVGTSWPYNLTLTSSSPNVSATLSDAVEDNAGSPAPAMLAYLDVAGTATTDTSNIRFVVITLTVRDATSGQSTVQRTRVSLRSG